MLRYSLGIVLLVELGCGADKTTRLDNKAAPVTDEQAPLAADWAEQAVPCPSGTTLERAVPDGSAMGIGLPGEPGEPDEEEVWCQDAAGIKHGPYQHRMPLSEERGRYRHGKKHGPWLESTRTDDGSGFIHSRGQYRQGQRHGQWISRYPGGQRAKEQHFDHGTPVGRHIEWYRSGQKSMEFSYDDSGVGTIWHDNGQKWFEVHTVRGHPDGTGTHWDARGKVQRIEEYKAGVLSKATDMRAGVRLVYEIANLEKDEHADEYLPAFIEELRERLPQPSTGLSLFIKGDTIVLEVEDVSPRAHADGDAEPGDDRARRIERAFAEPFPAPAIHLVDGQGNPADGRPALAGFEVADAEASWDPESNRPVVLIDFTDPATPRLAALTRANVGKRMTLTIGQEVIMDAVIQSAIEGGRVMVTMGGNSPQEMRAEARAMANKIRLGASNKTLRLRERSALGGPLPAPVTRSPVFPDP